MFFNENRGPANWSGLSGQVACIVASVDHILLIGPTRLRAHNTNIGLANYQAD